MRAVVPGEQNQRGVRQSQCVDVIDQASHQEVGVGDHIRETGWVVLEFRLERDRLAMRRHDERRVRQHHGVVKEERFVPMALDEIEREVGEHVWTVVVHRGVDVLAVPDDGRMPEARSLLVTRWTD